MSPHVCPTCGTEIIALTPRRKELMALLIEGYTDREIATRMLLTVRSVQSMMKDLYRELGVGNRVKAVRKILVIMAKNPDLFQQAA